MPQGQATREIELDGFEVLKIADIASGKDAQNFVVVAVPGFEDLECYVAMIIALQGHRWHSICDSMMENN